MSNNAMRAAREMAAGKRPLMFEEKPRPVGKGGAAFKSLTAAVKAAERERDEARALKVACDEVLAGCCVLYAYVRHAHPVHVAGLKSS